MTGILLPKVGRTPGHHGLDPRRRVQGVRGCMATGTDGPVRGPAAYPQIVGTDISGLTDRSRLRRVLHCEAPPGFIDRHDHARAIQHGDMRGHGVQHPLGETVLVLEGPLARRSDQGTPDQTGQQTEQIEHRPVAGAPGAHPVENEQPQNGAGAVHRERTQGPDALGLEAGMLRLGFTGQRRHIRDEDRFVVLNPGPKPGQPFPRRLAPKPVRRRDARNAPLVAHGALRAVLGDPVHVGAVHPQVLAHLAQGPLDRGIRAGRIRREQLRRGLVQDAAHGGLLTLGRLGGLHLRNVGPHGDVLIGQPPVIQKRGDGGGHPVQGTVLAAVADLPVPGLAGGDGRPQLLIERRRVLAGFQDPMIAPEQFLAVVATDRAEPVVDIGDGPGPVGYADNRVLIDRELLALALIEVRL